MWVGTGFSHTRSLTLLLFLFRILLLNRMLLLGYTLLHTLAVGIV